MRTVRRYIWLALALGHAALLGRLLPGSEWSEDIGSYAFRVLGLSGAVLFCLLKTFDVGWLRIRSGWKPTVSSLVVAALLHINVLARETGLSDVYAPAPLGVALLSTVLIEPDAFRRTIRELGSMLRQESARPTNGFDPSICSWVAIVLPTIRLLESGLVCQLPRPPPSH